MKFINFLHNINEDETLKLLNIIKCPKLICKDYKYNGQCNFYYGNIGKGLACKNCCRKFAEIEFDNIKILDSINITKQINNSNYKYEKNRKERIEKDKERKNNFSISLNIDSLENLHKNNK